MLNIFKKKQKRTEILSHTDYNFIFENNIVEDIPIEVLNIGNINLPTGKVVVCDPLVVPDMPPLSKSVSPGKYPIRIYIAKTQESGDRYAIAKLEFSDKKAVKWILALRDGEDVNELEGNGDFFGMPVDAGLGGFFDYKTGIEYNKFLDKFHADNPDGNIYDDFFAAEFKKNAITPDDQTDYGNWINYTFPNTDLNITMFQSGYGDGVYPAYWGLDEQGDIVSLVIDFFVVLLPDE
ncbi:MAG: DUF4241 domain-containing protein [Bacteroidales bacterium]|nr:DUF4241 domain-containing protein [Bacteroidales bacterium]